MNDSLRPEHPRPGRFDAEEIAARIRPDATDSRDRWYERNFDPAVLPLAVAPDDYRRYVGETWHQRGEECTGFALAAIANYSRRRHLDDPALPSVGPIGGSLLSALELLGDVSDGNGVPFGLGPLGGDPWERLAVAGRVEQAWVSGVGHVELMWDIGLHGRIASMMSAHRDHTEHTEPRWEPSTSFSTGVPTTAVPTDPLAYSKALRKRTR